MTLETCPTNFIVPKAGCGCGAKDGEECPYIGLTDGLLQSFSAVTAGQAGVCAVDGEECQSCQ